jgi:hypothetical protein
MQMPKSVARPDPGQSLVDFGKLQAVLGRGDCRTTNCTGGGSAAAPPKIPAQPPLDVGFETLDQLYPTYIVHAYRDTGTTINVGGQPRKVLQPQSSFGYYVHHDGALAGWDTALEGAQLIAPNYYLVAAVPEGGSKTVKTRIVAREQDDARYAVWLAAGRTFPHGSFHNAHDGGAAVTLGFEFAIAPTLAIEATLGGRRFDGRGGAGDIDVTQFGIAGKWYSAGAPLRWFGTAGLAGYAFDPGKTRLGAELGLGVQYAFAPMLSVEGRFGLHSVFGNAPNSTFSTLQLGLRWAF